MANAQELYIAGREGEGTELELHVLQAHTHNIKGIISN